MASNPLGVVVFDQTARQSLVRVTLDCLAEDHRDMEKFVEDLRANSLRPQDDPLLAEFERQMVQRINTKESG